MDLHHEGLRLQTRRHFFQSCALGVGKIALASLFAEGALSAQQRSVNSPTRRTHHPARAKSVIYLFMAGGPSQLELFDYKPQLQALDGQPIPESYLRERRFAFMDSFTREVPRMLAPRRRFARHGKSGAWVSDLLPHIASVTDDLA